eukprot:jgi/Mesvir1/14090/Mv21808-RA.1
MKGAGKLGSVGKGALSGAAHLTGSSVRSIGGKMGMTTKKITLAPEEERELAALADEVEGVMEEEEGGTTRGRGTAASSSKSRGRSAVYQGAWPEFRWRARARQPHSRHPGLFCRPFLHSAVVAAACSPEDTLQGGSLMCYCLRMAAI